MSSPALDLDPQRNCGNRVACIHSRWHKQTRLHQEIVDRGRDAFVACKADDGFAHTVIDLFEVTSSFDTPLQALRAAPVSFHAEYPA